MKYSNDSELSYAKTRANNKTTLFALQAPATCVRKPHDYAATQIEET